MESNLKSKPIHFTDFDYDMLNEWTDTQIDWYTQFQQKSQSQSYMTIINPQTEQLLMLHPNGRETFLQADATFIGRVYNDQSEHFIIRWAWTFKDDIGRKLLKEDVVEIPFLHEMAEQDVVGMNEDTFLMSQCYISKVCEFEYVYSMQMGPDPTTFFQFGLKNVEYREMDVSDIQPELSQIEENLKRN